MMMLIYCLGVTYLASAQQRKNTESWGPAQTSYFYSAEINSGIKFYKRTEEAWCLNQTELQTLCQVCQALPCHTTLPDLAGRQSLHIRLWFKCRASAVPKKYHTYVFWRDYFPARCGENFYVASVKYLTVVWLWHKGSSLFQWNLCAITFCRVVRCLLWA